MITTGAPRGTDAEPAVPAPPASRAPSVLLVTVLAALFALTFAGLRLHAHDGDLSVFVDAGDRVTDPRDAPANLTIVEDSLGYDGQLFYRLARNPLTEGRREFGIELVRPEYRHARIGYPLVAWVLSAGGREGLVPGALVAANIAAVTAIAALAGTLARDRGRSPAWGLLVAGWAGFTVALARDLSEPLAAALLLGALLAIDRRRWAVAALVLTAAALTRETSLVLALAIVGSHLLGRVPRLGSAWGLADRARSVPLRVAGIPLLAYGAWRAFLRVWWGPGANAENAPESFFVAPFTGLARQVGRWATDLSGADAVDLVQALQLLLVLIVLGLYATALGDRDAGRPHERLAFVGFLVLLALAPEWGRSVVFLRWPGEAVALGAVVAMSAPRLALRPLAATTGVLALTTVPLWITIT